VLSNAAVLVMHQQCVRVYILHQYTDRSVHGVSLAMCVFGCTRYLQDSAGPQLTASQPETAVTTIEASAELKKRALKNCKRKALRRRQREKRGVVGVGRTAKQERARSRSYKSMLQVCSRVVEFVLRSFGRAASCTTSAAYSCCSVNMSLY
jgi:hypothetical protein